MVDTTNKQTTDRQTTYKCYPIVPGGKSARDKKRFLRMTMVYAYICIPERCMVALADKVENCLRLIIIFCSHLHRNCIRRTGLCDANVAANHSPIDTLINST